MIDLTVDEAAEKISDGVPLVIIHADPVVTLAACGVPIVGTIEPRIDDMYGHVFDWPLMVGSVRASPLRPMRDEERDEW